VPPKNLADYIFEVAARCVARSANATQFSLLNGKKIWVSNRFWRDNLEVESHIFVATLIFNWTGIAAISREIVWLGAQA